MKKGASHVDWAISMSIFLVYVLLTFIFLKPASEPTYSNEILLDTVYSGLKNDTAYTIKKGYLVITPTSDINENKDYFLSIRNITAHGMSKDWKDSDREGLRHLTLVNDSLRSISCQNLTAITFDFVDEGYEDAHGGDEREGGTLEIVTRLKRGEDNTFWFLYSEELEFSPHKTVESEIADEKEDCLKRDDDGNRVAECLLDDKSTRGTSLEDPTNFTYQFGIVESFSAFSEEKLDQLIQNYDDKYEALKGNWSFPEDKNFNITIEKLI